MSEEQAECDRLRADAKGIRDAVFAELIDALTDKDEQWLVFLDVASGQVVTNERATDWLKAMRGNQ